MVAKCFYLSRNLFPSFGYGKLKCVFAVIWPYMWYRDQFEEFVRVKRVDPLSTRMQNSLQLSK